MVGGAMTWPRDEGTRPCRWYVEESHSLTFVMYAVSQILGHRFLDERSSFTTLDSAPHVCGTPNWEAICGDCVAYDFTSGPQVPQIAERLTPLGGP